MCVCVCVCQNFEIRLFSSDLFGCFRFGFLEFRLELDKNIIDSFPCIYSAYDRLKEHLPNKGTIVSKKQIIEQVDKKES